ncbi:MAG: hypothetical protein ABL903_08565 [Methylococcales bacterium]
MKRNTYITDPDILEDLAQRDDFDPDEFENNYDLNTPLGMRARVTELVALIVRSDDACFHAVARDEISGLCAELGIQEPDFSLMGQAVTPEFIASLAARGTP